MRNARWTVHEGHCAMHGARCTVDIARGALHMLGKAVVLARITCVGAARVCVLRCASGAPAAHAARVGSDTCYMYAAHGVRAHRVCA